MKAIFSFILCCLLAMPASAQLLRTTVAQGEVEGVEEQGMAHYKGIPFAQPPVGDLRWKAPVPASPWDGVYLATEFKPKPYQQSHPRPGQPGLSEDCLYLNVLTPAKSRDEKLPVLVWIHGGGFSTGASWEQNGINFAKNGIVYCSIAYRTNVFGFLSTPALSEESLSETGRAISGNYGLMDQLLALEWIRDNISAFGGDPDKVTIMGESAGGISVAMLCQSPLAKGLFRGAISESGGNMVPASYSRIDNNSVRTVEGSEAYGQAMLERLGLGELGLEELRALGPEAFMGDSAAFSAGGALWPCYDDYVLSSDAYRQYEAGNYNDVNVMIGTNSDEGSMFTGFLGGYTPAQYEQEMKTSFPDPVWQRRFREMYPGSTDQEAFDAHSDIFRDAAFAWPTYAWGNLQSARTEAGEGQGKVYMFFFDQARTNMFRRGQDSGRKFLMTHAAEMRYTFGGQAWGGSSDPRDAGLTRMVFRYWLNFIKNGDPNICTDGENQLPEWIPYSRGTESVMYFRDGGFLAPVQNQAQMDLWQEYFKLMRETNK